MTAKHLCDDTDLNNLHADYLVPWVSFNLRELELRVVWVHALDLFPCWSTQNLEVVMPQYVMVQKKLTKQWR